MTRAFEDLFGIPNGFEGVPFNGRTDAWILSRAAAAHGITDEALSRFKPLYLEYLAAELDATAPGPRKGVMPGVNALLDALAARGDGYLALLTGNFAEGARLKLEYFDLWRYFSCGAFGDTAHDRNGLLPEALARVAGCGGPRAAAADVVIIGDTPLDVAVAIAGGARSIAVATGSHTTDELRASGADVVFQDLSNLEAVLDALERISES